MALSKTDYQIRVIERVKRLRTEAGLSQQQLATILGVTNGQIGNIESLKYPHKYTLRQLSLAAKHFNKPTESFFMTDKESALTTQECIERICQYMEGE